MRCDCGDDGAAVSCLRIDMQDRVADRVHSLSATMTAWRKPFALKLADTLRFAT